MPPCLSTVLGKYRGGPGDPKALLTVFIDSRSDGVCKGLYKGSKGGAAAFEGRMIEGGKKIKGFWYDYDKGVTPAQRYECTCVIALEGHDVLKGNFRTKDGGHEEWEAKRWSEQDVPRADGKIIGFAIKDKATFERVTDNGKGKREAWLEGARATAMEESVPLKNFDGSLTYIPGPVVGAEFQTMFDIERSQRVKDAGHRDERIAYLEASVGKLEAKGAKGEDVKDKLEKAKALLKGEKDEKKMLEERADKPWKGGAGKFTADSSKHPEYLPDEYLTELEVARKLNKEDKGRPLKDKARMEAELPKLKAKIAAGEGDVDTMTRRLQFLEKMIAAKIPKEEDIKPFKPTSFNAAAPLSPGEHMPDIYFSAVDLERKLTREAKEREAAHLEKMAATVEALGKKAADGSITDEEKRKMAAFATIVKGEKAAAAAAGERKGFKPGSGMGTASRLSSSVMFHPVNMRNTIASMK